MIRDRFPSYITWPFVTAAMILGLVGACRSDPIQDIRAYAEGRLIISSQEDSTKDYSGFELLLASQVEGDIDTLGIAETAVDGSFSMSITATEAGVFPLIISRSGVRLAVEEFVVADGDSTKVSASFPLEGRRMRIVSPENAAWAAYRNAKYQHNQSLLELVQTQNSGINNMEQVVLRTSMILWSLRSTFPRAMASDLAAVESIAMLEGWSDSIVVARLPMIELDNKSITGAIRAARRSVARMSGLDSSLAMVRGYLDALTDAEDRAELQAELVVAYADSSLNDEALAAALELRRIYPDSEWALWAGRAIYEFENLLPGMMSPAFSVITTDGNTVSSESLRGKFLVLEFFQPTNEIFLKEMGLRNSVFSSLDPRVFQTLSISLERDAAINEALFEEGIPPGVFAFAPEGQDSDLARLFNIRIIPTRFLINPDGEIVAKYPGSSMITLEDDLIDIYSQIVEDSESSPN